MRLRRTIGIRTGMAIGLALLIVGCDSNSKSSSPTSPSAAAGTSVSYVYLTGNAPATGGTSQFTAMAVLPDGAKADVTVQSTWKTSNPAIMTVSSTGLVTGVAAGTADISATYQNTTGSTPVTVSTMPCTFTLQPAQLSVPKEGGTAVVNVTMTMGVACAWTAQVDQPFLTITSGASGIGNGTVNIAVAPNAGVGRSGLVTVAGRTVTVSQGQANCVTGLSPVTQHFGVSGASGTATVTAPAGCEWLAESGASFITFIGSPRGIGDGSFQYRVAGNTSGSAREGSVIVEQYRVQVTQDVPTGTYLAFDSDVGDYIGQGVAWVYVAPDASFSPSMNSQSQLTVRVVGSNGLSSATWNLSLQAPNGAPLVAGTYENATRWPFQAPSVPGLSLSGDGRACNQLSGRFVVREAVYAPTPTPLRFWATFEQHCEGRPAALRGEISIGR